jgi:hypothetical protein
MRALIALPFALVLVLGLRKGTHTIDFAPSGEGALPPTHSVITVR